MYRFLGGTDGAYPQGVIQGDDGNLYGVTSQGGNMACGGGIGCGTVFEISSTGEKTTLHIFEYQGEGTYPTGSLFRDSAGNLYGTTESGGSHNYGVVFKLSPKGKLTLLHQFADETDGAYPQNVRLIPDDSGNLYGTAGGGGDLNCFPPYGCGVVFKLAPDGTETVLHAFHGMPDGWGPFSGLTRDDQGNLYGTTPEGGSVSGDNCTGGCGTIFKIASDGTETVLHSFDGAGGGFFPDNPPLLDKAGNLYGTTIEGGNLSQSCPVGCGVIYKLATNGSFKILYAFSGGADSFYPEGGLRMDSRGNLFGNTSGSRGSPGTVFRLAPNGEEHTLHTFSHSDGIHPDSRLVTDGVYWYGTTYQGGGGRHPRSHGTVFKISK